MQDLKDNLDVPVEIACLPPRGDQTNESLADEDRKAAYWNGCQAFHALGGATELMRKANIAILKGEDDAATSLFEQAKRKSAEAVRSSEIAALHLKRANFYLNQVGQQGEKVSTISTATQTKSPPTAS